MRVYEVVGVERVSGTSRKSGQPFSMTRLSLLYEDPSNRNLAGHRCMEVVPFDSVFSNSHYEPAVGDVISLVYEPGFKGEARLVSIQLVND